MLRGFRWQLIALLMASVLFALSMLTRQAPDTLHEIGDRNVTETHPEPTTTSEPLPPTVLPTVDDTRSTAPPLSVETFREGLVGQVQRLNPLLAGLNPVDRDIASLIFEGLVKINSYGEVEPLLAKEWVLSSDGLEYIITLRDDVFWQDGFPFTADDVAYTMSLLRSPDFPGPEEVGFFWQTVETDQLSTHLVRFRLTQPLGSFLEKLVIGILPYHALQGTSATQIADHPFNLSPIGTGAYQLEAIRSTDNVRIRAVDLRVSPVYRQRPEGQAGYQIDRLRFQLYETFDEALAALRSGEIDGLATRSRTERAQLMAVGSSIGAEIHTSVDPSVGLILFNWQRESTRFFREQRVRLALEVGLDRVSIVERWMRNTAIRADSPLVPGSWAYKADLDWPPYDMATARFLLETANIPSTMDNGDEDATSDDSAPLVSFDILAPDDPALANMVSEIAAQWSQLNINVGVEAVDYSTYKARLDAGEFDAALVELFLGSSADPDVYAFWHQGQYPDGANYGGVDDRRISEVLEMARRDASGINRTIHYETFQRDFVDRAIALPLYYPLYTYITAAEFENIQLGFVGVGSDRFVTIREWARKP
jgi:peptide/nickel transport system substrate-binding protein